MTWLPAVAAGPTDVDRTFGLRPNLYDSYRALAALFWSSDATTVVPTPEWPA